MPGLYHGADFDLAGFAVGFGERGSLLGAHRVQARDRLYAIESSGLHSNGFSLVRKLIERDAITADQKLPFSPETAAALLLRPTTIYVRALKPVLQQPGLHALAHLTGGGLFENLPRVLPAGHRALVSSKTWPIPSLFTWIQERAGLTTPQLLSTFNAGVGMIAVADAALGKELIGSLHEQGLRCWEIGQVEAAPAGAAPEVVWD
jgi:phosphoribosylformylglycinamidine cyclo-ligase